MIKPTQQEKAWLLANKEELQNFFSQRINRLKEEVFLVKTSKVRDRKIDFINEYEKCLYLIGIFTKDDSKENKNYI